MSIQMVCPNGHHLSVQDSSAGKTGMCPLCKARVRVPEARHQQLSEDAILNILRTRSPKRGSQPAATDEPQEGQAPSVVDKEGPSPPRKSCYKCNREILAGTHICPYCHTYIANLGDF